jgi:serine/threonine protein kinase/tetratricopeptide (TPR) repeat protein
MQPRVPPGDAREEGSPASRDGARESSDEQRDGHGRAARDTDAKTDARQLDPASRLTRVTSSAHKPRSSTNVRLLPGRLVPGTRYRIVRWLGEGGMGVVYEVEHADIERRAALKILRVDASRDPTLARRFRDEARAASRIGSEHIVEIYDFGELPDGRLMFAMELLHGHSLVEELDRAPIDPSRLISILRQACKGLGVAHEVGIVHRDIKPENILLTERAGRPDHVRIVDFGIARMFHAHDELESSAAGTPHYMAPEQCAGVAYDGRVDMYSLGCTAYELIVGDPPFLADNLEAILTAHVDQPPVPPSQRVEGLEYPSALEAVILRCLAKSHDDRYTDMRDLEAALCEAQIEAGIETAWDDLPLPEVEPDRRERLIRRMPNPEDAIRGARSRRWLWPAVAAIGMLTAVALGVQLVYTPEPTTTEVGQVEELTIAARAAAARAYWVYPPVHNPHGDTAYRKVRSLESVTGSAETLALDRATELREEFTTTLVRLGDRYWDRAGGKPFASDYYAQALVFDPDNPRAEDRAPLLPGELADLRRKAATGGFTVLELEAARPLAVMAADSDDEVIEGLETLRDQSDGSSVSRDAKVDRFILAAARKPRPPRAASQPAHARDGKSEMASDRTGDDTEMTDAPPATKPSDPPEPPRPRRDRHAAQALVKQARSARRTGDSHRAERLYHQALASDNRNTAALIGLSDIYFDRSNHKRAVDFAEKAVAASPNQAGYRVKLGDAYFKILRYQDARREYERALALGHEDARQRLEKLRAKLGR